MKNKEGAHSSTKCTEVHGVRAHVNLTRLFAKLYCKFSFERYYYFF